MRQAGLEMIVKNIASDLTKEVPKILFVNRKITK
jgi:hypothetical protein